LLADDASTDTTATNGAVERLGLAARELSVLELVATGMTNRQIGEQLFMSQKTASVHVSRILAKLEVSSRHGSRHRRAAPRHRPVTPRINPRPQELPAPRGAGHKPDPASFPR
jgi:DNA-binding CsgD family transcriptional regulator